MMRYESEVEEGARKVYGALSGILSVWRIIARMPYMSGWDGGWTRTYHLADTIRPLSFSSRMVLRSSCAICDLCMGV